MLPEFIELQKKTADSGITSFPYYQHMIPKQANRTDSGICMLQYVEMFAEDESFILKDREVL